MRQVGILAAAGLYALDHNISRLADDHARAARLAAAFGGIEGLSVEANTNIVWVGVPAQVAGPLGVHLADSGIGITSGYGGRRQRWVTHLDIGDADVDAGIAAMRGFFEGRQAAAAE
jgi:threonine aldolase